MKSIIRLVLIFITVVFAIYLFVGQTQTQTPIPDQQVKTETTAKTFAKVAPENILLAEIDEHSITGADFNRYLALFKNGDQKHSGTPALRERQLNNLINRILLLDEADKQGYFKDDKLKKHSSLNTSEHETIVLRQFLTDKISRPATINDADLNTYLKTHPQINPEQAREQLTSKRQQQLFQKMMHDLKKEHNIVIHHENLTKF